MSNRRQPTDVHLFFPHTPKQLDEVTLKLRGLGRVMRFNGHRVLVLIGPEVAKAEALLGPDWPKFPPGPAHQPRETAP